ncbi:MAG: cysteine desulfurase [Dehalococcoidia bacterium]
MSFRNDFPIMERLIHDKPLTYLDSAATSQKPAVVIDALADFYRNNNANVHRGIYTLSEESTLAYETARDKVAKFIKAGSERNIVFTRNTTESLNLIAYAWGREHLKQGDEILITPMEHHSNIVPWMILCNEIGSTIKYIPINEDGTLDLSDLDELISEKTKIVSLTHMSNVLGTINPIKEIIAKANKVSALSVVDGAQGAPHLPVDVVDLDVDLYAFSAHKMLGPTGVGVLYGKDEILSSMRPFLGGGEMIDEVYEDRFTWKEAPLKFEAGTPNFADVAAFGVAIDYLDNIGMENVRKHEIDITTYAMDQVKKIDMGIKVFGPEDLDIRGGVLAFDFPGVHPHDVAQMMDWDGIQIRAGHHCAQPLMRRLGVAATARASFYIYNNEEDVDRFVDSLKKGGEFFGDASR